ncbi:hypothetical protein ACJX0J_034886, partial [Zea mays]
TLDPLQLTHVTDNVSKKALFSAFVNLYRKRSSVNAHIFSSSTQYHDFASRECHNIW